MHISVPIEGTAQVIEHTQLSPLVSKCKIKVLYVDNKPNRNGTVITRKVAEEMGSKLPGSPICGFYDANSKDFDEHNREFRYDEVKGEFGFVDLGMAYGFVPTDAQIWFQEFQDDDGVTRLYLCCDAIVWTEAYPESKRILEHGNNQSMKLNDKSLKGSWAGELNSANRFFIINEALIEKLQILGENVEPCFEGAQIRSEFSLRSEIESLRQSVYSLIKTFKEGGKTEMEENKVLDVIDTPTQEYAKSEDEKKKEDQAPENSKDKNNQENNPESKDNTEGQKEEEDKKKKKEYSLNDIPEYVDLMAKYTTLQSEYSALEQQKSALEQEIEPLREFKLEKEKEDKQAMIDSFYMLSDEDKKDVVEHINEYSLSDIESKLSVICVRNKVSFSLEEQQPEPQKDETAGLTYSLNSAVEQSNDSAPDWVKAVRKTEKEMI